MNNDDRRTTGRGLQAVGIFGLMLVGSMLIGCEATEPNSPKIRELANACVEEGVRYPDNPAVRAQAIEAATAVRRSEASLIIHEGLDDEHAGVRFAACLALAELRDKDSIERVRLLVKDPDPNVRVGAYLALERMGDKSYRKAWADALRRDPDPAVRRNAALAMGLLGDPAVLPLLQQAATEDGDEGVELQAIEAMALLGDEEAIGRLIHDAFGGVGFRQPFALLTLGRVSDPRVVVALRSRLANAPYLEARLAAARALGMQGKSEGYDLALNSLTWNEPKPDLPDDPPENQVMRVHTMAALALGDIGDPRALRPLAEQMIAQHDPRVQLACATAVLKILNGSKSS